MGSISIRIPAENYDKTIAELRKLAKSITNESTSSQDVTEEYTDLASRVKNLEATETQLLKIMESANKTEDVLAVQRELTQVRGEIEQAKGRLQYLERTTSTSLIQISLDEAMIDLKFSADKVRVDTDEAVVFTSEVLGGFPPYSYEWYFGDGEIGTEASPSHAYKDSGVYSVSLKVTDDKGYTNTINRGDYIFVTAGWNPGSIARGAISGLTVFFHAVVNVLIWLVVWIPLWIVIGAVIWFILRRRKKISRP